MKYNPRNMSPEQIKQMQEEMIRKQFGESAFSLYKEKQKTQELSERFAENKELSNKIENLQSEYKNIAKAELKLQMLALDEKKEQVERLTKKLTRDVKKFNQKLELILVENGVSLEEENKELPKS